MKRSSQTDFRGQSYKHRRFFDRKVIFDFSELSPNERAAFLSIPSLRGRAHEVIAAHSKKSKIDQFWFFEDFEKPHFFEILEFESRATVTLKQRGIVLRVTFFYRKFFPRFYSGG